MKARLFCKHCRSHHEVELDEIKRLQQDDSTMFTFAHNTYYFEDKLCFFEMVKLETSKMVQQDT